MMFLTRNYHLYERYYRGDHEAQLPSATLKRLQRYTNFRLNLCDVVVDALAERLVLTGFTISGADDETARRVTARLSAILDRCRFDEQQAVVHNEAVRLGDAFVVVDYDGRRNTPHLRYNPASMFSVTYRDASNMELTSATKQFDDGRRVVYYADRVERYDRDSVSVQPILMPNGEPIGVPVVHFRNRHLGEVYGHSELENIIPLQDAINKTLVDLLLILDQQGFPQRWVRGKRPPQGWMVGPGIVWNSDDPQFEAGELPAANPDGLLNALDRLINIAAGRSRTPQHLFHIEGEYPSGEALKTAEAGLVSKVRNRQTTFGNCWETVARLCLRMDNAFGGYDWPLDQLVIQAVWQDTETKNPLMQAQAVSTKAPWLSHKQILRELGYTDPQIERIIEEFRQDKLEQQQLGDELLRKFEAGNYPDWETGGQAVVRNPER